MGRYYQTAQPQFLQNFIYQPPWQLMQQALQQKQQEYDTAQASTDIFKNLSINHLNSIQDNETAKQKQQYYLDKVDELSNKLKQDPLHTKKYADEIKSLGRELYADYKEGDISKLQQSYAAVEQWKKDNEQMKKDSPSRYNAALNYYTNTWKGNSLNNIWKGDIVSKDIDWDGIEKSAKDLESDIIAQNRTTPQGMYMVERSGKTEYLSKDKLYAYAVDKILSDQNNLNSMRQSQQFGLGNYFDKDGKLINPLLIEEYDTGEKDAKGNSIKAKRYTTNPLSSLHSGLEAIGLHSYKKVLEDTLKYSENGAYSAAQSRAISWANYNLSKEELAWKKDKASQDKQDKYIDALQKVIDDPKTDPTKKQDAINKRDQMLGITELMSFPGSTGNFKDMIQNGANIDLILDSYTRGFSPGMKAVMSTAIQGVKNGTIKSVDEFYKQATISYLRSPAGKKEFMDSPFKYISYDISTKNDIRTKKYYTKEEKERAYNDLISGKSSGVNTESTQWFNNKIREFENKIGTQMDNQLKKYGTSINSGGVKLTSDQSTNIISVINKDKDSFVFYDSQGNVKNVAPDISSLNTLSTSAKGTTTRVFEGKDNKGNTIYITTKDSQRDSPVNSVINNYTKDLIGEDTQLGMRLRNNELNIRQNYFNRLIRANSNNGTWYSDVVKDPAGGNFGIQAIASGYTSNGVGQYKLYWGGRKEHYTPTDVVSTSNGVPITFNSIEEASSFANKYMK